MSTASPNHEAGGLLSELEQRQDEVLDQLDELDARVREVLQGLGITEEDESPEIE